MVAIRRCGEMGARLVSMESERENDFVTQNLLWIGFLGEAYTGTYEAMYVVIGGVQKIYERDE